MIVGLVVGEGSAMIGVAAVVVDVARGGYSDLVREKTALTHVGFVFIWILFDCLFVLICA